ncbi:hemagglutinin repeat-containing protein [Pantoea agglomerans]|uniref:hemagglutinin repeat-containing protein n=1 Tax=Enterobacter agglomerans TaxID=549 RepID=UPI00289D3A4B|nr:hemagglutinin repeat-containing protein [Pantoea agglomerans]WNK50150.1 hemagglutinin repeat-containing protein [Pantoea agglomerans]
MDDQLKLSLPRRLLSYLICSLIAFQPLLPAFSAAIAPVTPGTKVDAAGNGVPVINIATPNAAGLSHNQYQNYNVGQEGLILNNATGRLTQTQLGGLVQNNPNLKAGQEARAIINEVVGANHSQLQGYTEVAGKAANVMVANPYGITCNGCGFINTPNVTLTTGKPQLDAQGNLQSLEVTKGAISIEGKGLDGSQADAVSIIARATEINAGIHAKDLNVTLGANRVGADGRVTPIAGEGAAPAVAVDTGALGGMYANRIHLVSSENGVGVNLGNLNARQGDMVLDAQGRLSVNNSLTSGTLTAKGSSIALQGEHKAGGNVALTAQQDIALNGASLGSDASLDLNSQGSITLKGSSVKAGQNVRLSGANLSVDNSSSGSAVDALQLSATSQLDNAGQLAAAKTLDIQAAQIANSGSLTSNGDVQVRTNTLQQNGKLLAQGKNTLAVSGQLTNRDEISGSSLNIQSGTLDNSGKLISTGDATITANRLNQDGIFSAQGNALFSVADTFSNSGNLVSQRLQIDAPTLNNSGEMVSHGDAVINSDTLQQNGSITARGDAQLTARGRLENQGAISSQNALILNSAQLRNMGSLTAPNLTLTAGQISNGGLLQGSNQLSLHAGQLDNLAAGTISSDNDFALNLPQLNNSGLITSGKTLVVSGDQLNNSGEINAASLSARYGHLDNQLGGKLLASDPLQLHGDVLTNQGIIAAAALNSDVSQINNSGTLQGDKAVSLQGSGLTNSGTLLSAGQLSVKQQTLENSGLMQGKQLTLNADRWQNSGNALSEADADLQSDTLVNSGKILGQQGIALKANHTDNSGWLIAQALTLRGDMINSGLIQGNQQVTLAGDQLDNQQGGQLLSDGILNGNITSLNNHGAMQADQMALNAKALQNSGTVRAGKALTAQVGGVLDNSGSLISQQQMNLQAGEIDNKGTLAADNLSLHAPVLSNTGLLQGNSTLTLDHQQLHNLHGGQLIAGGPLTLTLDQLDNDGLLQVNGKLSVNGNRLNNSGRLLSDDLDLQIADTLNNSSTGQIVTGQQADLHAQTLSNSGQIAARQLSASGNTLENSGLLQGDTQLDLGFAQTLNHNNGQLLSGDRLIIKGGSAINDGSWQGQQLDVTLDSLDNRGSINGISALRGNIASDLINSGTLVSQGNSDLNATTLRNSGKIMADRLGLQGTSLNNDGLLQGNTALTAQADNVTQSAGGKTLSGGTLTLTAGQLNTQGTLQGEQATVNADNWLHQGSLLGSTDLNASISNELHNTGSLMSQNTAQVTANTLNNSGSLLSEGAMVLNGAALNNSGSVQGKTLTISPASVINQGSLIGLQALTFAAAPQVAGRMLLRALAAPSRQLINNQGGSLLTQGTLNINGGDVVNNGSWQGQQILLNARQLTNNGAIQSADALQLILADRLDAGAGSKISANGTAALQALTLTNQGEWIARNLTLRGDTLNNNGAVTGVEALTVGLNGALTQQQDKTLLSAGRLTLQSSSLNNAGRVQGGDLQITSGVVDNNGRLQGDNSLLVNAGGRITNGGNGAMITQNALTLTGPELFNYGLIQGNGNGVATITGLTQNDGRWLSGGAQTLNTPQLNNNGWLQASQLILNATNASNNGTLLADGQGTLTGNGFSNQGTAQGGNLEVNYQQVNNSGTLLGNNRLSVMGAQVNQQSSGRLFSGGSLLVHSNGFDQTGQVVALGDATLEIANGFTGRDVLAAGGRLTVSSNGAIDNQGTMQGGALTLSAGGDLTNNGQLTTGSGDSTLSGNRIAMNGNGSLQGGGNINLASRSDITVDGFTGTLGNLTLSAPGSIVNNALLYAAGNLSLFANSIRNQRADMLAGGSMWLQGDAAGNANGEVINNSGTIETQNGDITINTGHLLNTRDGLSVSETHSASNQTGLGVDLINVPISEFKPEEYGVFVNSRTTCDSWGKNGQGCKTSTAYYYVPTKEAAIKSFSLSSTTINVTSNGGAARIAAGRNINIRAGSLDNQASNVLAQRDISLSGNQLNNQSWQAGTQSTYFTYKHEGILFDYAHLYTSTSENGYQNTYATTGSRNKPKVKSITYTLSDQGTSFTPGELYRSVIQAGGNVSANFSGDISNTNTTANASWSGNTLSAPNLRGLTVAGTAGAQSHQPLATADKAAINTPQWRDQLQNALQQVNGAGALESASQGSASLTQYATAGKNNAALGKAVNLTNVAQDPASLHNYKVAEVDISAYPLPSGENGYFVASNTNSRYLITVNPKLNGLGQLDQSLFGELNAKLGKQPATTPLQETRPQYTDENAFLGSSYMLSRLNLKPDYDYRFLGDAAFDTRYVSNAVLNQTGNRYINGLGSDLAQMRYLMDNAAAAQQSLGLEFGVSLSAGQLASLDKSMVWWEATTINGETVMVPKLYLSTKDVEMRDGSVIAGNNVTLKGGNITNTGSSVMAKNDLTIDSQNTLSNLNAGLLHAGGDLQLSALNDINNVSATISGKKVALESVNGDINNLTTSQLWHLDAGNGKGAKKSYTETLSGPTASITSLDSLSLKAGNDIAVTGANLKAGGELLLNAWNDIAITGNQNVTGSAQSGFGNRWQKVDLTSTTTVTTVGSKIAAGGNMAMQAGHDLTVTASSITAGKNAALAAGNDLNLNSATTSQNDVKGKRETHSTGLDRTTLTSGGDLALQAGRDLNSQAAGIAADKDVTLQAGRDVNLLAAETGSGNSYKSGKKVEINESVRQQGTEIASGGSTTVKAGQDVNSEAAQVTASGNIAVGAGRDINLTTATESDYAYKEETKTKKGFLSKKTTHTISEDSDTRENGTLLSGDNVTLNAGNNLLVQGSQVVGDGTVALRAGNNVDIVAATNSDSTWRFSETKKSGLMGTGGIGITVGSSKSVHDLRDKGTTQSQSASTVGSTGGNVSIVAGGQAHVSGSDLVAGRDLAITGDSVIIDPGHDKRTHDELFEQKKSGLTLALSGVVGEAINNAVAAAQTSKKESDGRLAALQATKAALSGVQAVLGGQLAEASADPNNGLGVSLSLTTQKSKSQQHQASDSVAGSTLNAGKNLSITSAGKGRGEHSGDILIAGSQLKAASDSSLNAARDIVLSGAANTQESNGKNSSGGGGVGISFGAGQGSAGISIFASVNGAKGKESGNGTRWSETTLDSGGRVSLNSGRDTTLNGAQVSGNQVTADVGRDLTITSQQDSDRYDSKQTSYGAGGSFTFGSMSVSGYASVNQDKMHSNFDSVQEQSGIYAGNGGFDITVGNHTQLNGAVIASQGDAADNRLDTGTLGFTDIGNAADYSVSHSGGSIALSSGGGMGAQMLSSVASNAASTLLSGLNNNGHAEGTTQSAVANGTVIIRDRVNQKQDVADLSRDTEHANDSISAIFDKEKEQKRLQTAQLAGEISGQMTNIVTTMGDIKGLEKARSAKNAETLPAGATEKQRREWLEKMRDSPEYQAEMKQWGIGSTSQKVAQTVGSILTGLVTGNAGQAVAGGLNPWAAQLIKKETTDASGNVDVATNAMAHAVWGAVSSQMSGGSAAAGAAGAFSGELATRYIAEKYWGADTPEKIAALGQEDREQLSLLGTLAAGLAGGMAGNSSAAATSGAVAGKNAVENNALSVPENQDRAKEMTQCQGREACTAVVEKYKKINAEQHESVVNCTGAQDCVDKANDVGKLQADYAKRTNELMEKARANGSLSPEDQNELSILQVTTIQLEADRNAAIHNALMSGDSSEAKQLAINSLAQVAGTSAAGIAAGIGKGKGSAMPIPTPTKAANGLVYQSNGKHTPGQVGYNRNAGTEPTNSIQLFGNSVENGKKRYALDEKGNVHQFTNTNDGSWHWSGSTGDASVPLKKSDIPNAVKKEFGLPGKWR